MIQEYVENIMRNGINNFAGKHNKTIDEVQILISWNDEEQKPNYKKMIQGEGSIPVTFNEILDVRFDMMNREAICGSFITKTLDRFSKELACMMSNLFVVIYLVDTQEGEDVKLHLYRGSEAIKEINLEEILI
jgi:hypothetical protein